MVEVSRNAFQELDNVAAEAAKTLNEKGFSVSVDETISYKKGETILARGRMLRIGDCWLGEIFEKGGGIFCRIFSFFASTEKEKICQARRIIKPFLRRNGIKTRKSVV